VAISNASASETPSATLLDSYLDEVAQEIRIDQKRTHHLKHREPLLHQRRTFGFLAGRE